MKTFFLSLISLLMFSTVPAGASGVEKKIAKNINPILKNKVVDSNVKKAPPFELKSTENKNVTLGELNKDKILLLVFYRTGS